MRNRDDFPINGFMGSFHEAEQALQGMGVSEIDALKFLNGREPMDVLKAVLWLPYALQGVGGSYVLLSHYLMVEGKPRWIIEERLRESKGISFPEIPDKFFDSFCEAAQAVLDLHLALDARLCEEDEEALIAA